MTSWSLVVNGKRLNHQGNKGSTKALLRRSQVELSPHGSKLKDILSLTDAFGEPVASREGREGLEVGLKAGNRFWAPFLLREMAFLVTFGPGLWCLFGLAFIII